jgi:hypothetical protein
MTDDQPTHGRRHDDLGFESGGIDCVSEKVPGTGRAAGEGEVEGALEIVT